MNAEREILVKRLKEAGFDTRRFLKLDAEKEAFEKDWPNKLYAPEEMGDHPYWGICGRDRLVLVDADKAAMESILRQLLPSTFEVRSPRRELAHFYLVVEGEPVPNKTLYILGDVDEKGRPIGSGEIRAQNEYVVAPGTEIHFKDLATGEPKTGRYIIAQDRPFARMQSADFMKAVEPYLGKDSTQKITFKQMREGVARGNRHAQGIKYATFLIGALGLGGPTALFEMRRWNELNQPPMGDEDLIRAVENAAGYVAANPREGPEDLDALTKLAVDPKLEEIFLVDINRTVVKYDDHVSRGNLYVGMSTYSDPFNNALKAISGAGKSYGTIEAMEYFPDGDVIIIGSQSPKVVSHDYGELMTKDGEPLNLDDAPTKPLRRDYKEKNEFDAAEQDYKEQKRVWDAKLRGSYNLIRLDNKIYVFLESISPETFEMFKCTMSHDKRRITHKFVDDRGKVHVTVLEGWPSFILLSVDKYYSEEQATRTFTISPDTSKLKIEAAKKVSINKKSYPWDYEQDSPKKKQFKALIAAIRDVMKSQKLKVLTPFPNLDKEFSSDVTRDMRDFQHFLQMLPARTIFHLFQRPIITIESQKYLVTTISDVVAAKELFDSIAETTKTGTDKRILDFYHTFVQHHTDGAPLQTILGHVFSAEDKTTPPTPPNEYTARRYLWRLEEIGWVDIKEGMQEDKRRLTFYPLKDTEAPTQQKLSESTCKPQMQTDLEIKLKEGFKTWVETINNKHFAIQLSKIVFQSREEEIIEPRQFTKQISGIEDDVLLIVSTPNPEQNPEKEQETTCKPEMHLVPLNSESNGVEPEKKPIPSLLNGTGNENKPKTPAPEQWVSDGYKHQDQTVYVRRIATGEPCIKNCGLASEWQVECLGSTQCFCDGCFREVKNVSEQCGFKVVFREAGPP